MLGSDPRGNSVNYRKYFEKLKKMSEEELTDEVEENRRDLEGGGADAEIRFALSKYLKVKKVHNITR
ncbi:hypothetical protein AKJ43_01890 [candidate division MSBL1 archaeon SCGC-AAA261D19]|uniref:Uncharacterized protein n=1 Tax=candidate division MSBL1 archaeon SCGC-AAA261D19 TaxID=1698273 RepID=A0A133V7C8_9EURY|nr:hypothetical protein AKJ43_01890 [candidate division MSBL1 archaeon SCGC-AAA261D19]